MRCVEAIGHELVLEGLWRAARAKRLAHALCFVGPEGVGKFLSAERLALGLVCARGIGAPCGTCGPCKRAQSDSHPDIFVIDPTISSARSFQMVPVCCWGTTGILLAGATVQVTDSVTTRPQHRRALGSFLHRQRKSRVSGRWDRDLPGANEEVLNLAGLRSKHASVQDTIPLSA